MADIGYALPEKVKVNFKCYKGNFGPVEIFLKLNDKFR